MAKILVIGAGPAGLATARALRQHALKVEVVDRHGVSGGAFLRMYPNLVMSSPRSYLSLPGAPLAGGSDYIQAREYAEYLSRYATKHGIAVTQGNVVAIRRVPAALLVMFTNVPIERAYDAVVVATGMFDNPIIPVIPGLPSADTERAPHVMHANAWTGPSGYPEGTILIVGAGMRAVEIAEEAAGAGRDVVVSSRGGRIRAYPRKVGRVDTRHLTFPILRRIPIWLADSLCAGRTTFPAIDNGINDMIRCAGVALKPELLRFQGSTAVFVDGSTTRVDLVIFATGHKFAPPTLYSDSGMDISNSLRIAQGECRALKNVFLVGHPCAFRPDSHFLHGIARDSALVARKLEQRFSPGATRKWQLL